MHTSKEEIFTGKCLKCGVEGPVFVLEVERTKVFLCLSCKTSLQERPTESIKLPRGICEKCGINGIVMTSGSNCKMLCFSCSEHYLGN